jgi:hypothetical protein
MTGGKITTLVEALALVWRGPWLDDVEKTRSAANFVEWADEASLTAALEELSAANPEDRRLRFIRSHTDGFRRFARQARLEVGGPAHVVVRPDGLDFNRTIGATGCYVEALVMPRTEVHPEWGSEEACASIIVPFEEDGVTWRGNVDAALVFLGWNRIGGWCAFDDGAWAEIRKDRPGAVPTLPPGSDKT